MQTNQRAINLTEQWPRWKRQYDAAYKSLLDDKALEPKELVTLSACLEWRRRDREFSYAMREEVKLEKAGIESSVNEERDFWKGPSLLAKAIRFWVGELFSTQSDFIHNEERDKLNMSAAQARRPRYDMHNAMMEKNEKALRAKLAGASPHAKYLFNAISISRSTMQHFPAHEIPARPAPHPIERILAVD